MALNPIVYTEKVVSSFLRYQLTAYAFADTSLRQQMRDLLQMDKTRETPLLKGPYISLSRSFEQGAAVADLITDGVFHPHMRERIPSEITHVYGHQEQAIRAIHAKRTTLVSTGTGSGKTECFLYPIISKCLQLKDEGAPPGISAVIVYPMNALAEDQLGRLRSLLAGTGIPFGMYVGKTPQQENHVAGFRMPEGSTRAAYEAKVEEVRREKRSETVYPAEEICSREIMRTQGRQPRILLTNVKQLELLLTRQSDVELFADARLDFLVFDEAHTFTGAQGAESACLIRRLRSFCGQTEEDSVCVATSATIVDEDTPDAARHFASRFFGVPADQVETVGESYEAEVWGQTRTVPSAPKRSASDLLTECVQAVDDKENAPAAVRQVYKDLCGSDLPEGDWGVALHGDLSRNELVFQINEALATPKPLAELVDDLSALVGRDVPEAEILCWLSLGAAARVDGRPLLRPVVHGFIRGISGAVVSFTEGSEPKLWLAAEDELEASGEETPYAHFPVLTCTTCGQHYFTTHLKDFSHTAKSPGGGEASGASSYWERLDESQGGCRVVLTNRMIGDADDEELESDRTSPLYFCRHCGSAHPASFARCAQCSTVGEPVVLHSIKQKKDNPGYLSSCLSCGAISRRHGSRYREPARPVRATNVADVHVLAQDMVEHADRHRLLVFCDNRQDAAFQSGWMKDHARRFRLRSLMAQGLQQGQISIGDLTLYLDDILEKDEPLSRALVPEVWQVKRKEGSGGRHEQERQKFLRIQVLREVALSTRQVIGLEPWGRMRVDYEGFGSSISFVQTKAGELGLPPDDLRDGLITLLDYLRRRRILHDPEFHIFSKYWMDGNLEVMQGYVPQVGGPVGTKILRGGEEKPALVTQWLSNGGDTTIKQLFKKWGVDPDHMEDFAEEVFDFFVESGYLVPVTLTGSKGNPVSGVSGVYQVNADKLRLGPNKGVYLCLKCRRRFTRRSPNLKCSAWRCDGTLEFQKEDPDNYDLQLLDERYSMLRPEEHTAMVPHAERERIENLFKGESEAINALVCTPTLEMGVDIGKLDAILMRNVPPLPANYWQRAGRAGRRHRMAVDIAYCRPVSHDRAYFNDPLKMLDGRIDPPAFNLRNDLMVSKHVHAAIITRLHQYTRGEARSAEDQAAIKDVLLQTLPNRITPYLFDEGHVRTADFDLSPLNRLIESNRTDLHDYIMGIFTQGWPERDADVVTAEALDAHIAEMTTELNQLIGKLRRRLKWAMAQMKRLNVVRDTEGTLEPEDDALFRRCDRMIKRLKGTAARNRREAEGYDDSNTFGVLAAEGFLPGYGLASGSILATAEVPYWKSGAMEFGLPRPPAVALREYVPGNLIYANGNKFVARRFHRDVDEDRIEIPTFEISTERQAIKETNRTGDLSQLGAMALQAISVCDLDLVHQSHISDEEETRFQMAVTVFGKEQDQHNGGVAYKWGPQSVQIRKGVRLRLVNVGSSNAIERFQRFGYPVCSVCGQSVSPLSSARQREQFEESHKERCGRAPHPVGFYADVVADVLSLPACASHSAAYSVLEAIRVGATRVLDMHLDDLQILIVGHVDRDEVDALLWDPMPGGSGLLEQIRDNFQEVLEVAKEVCEQCPSACDTSCVDCLQTFRNSFYHKYLDRHLVLTHLDEWGERLIESHPIPVKQPSQADAGGDQPVNNAEQKLRALLLAAGLGEGVRGEQIKLDRTLGSTTPDVIFRGDFHDDDEGVCIYLDGMSAHLHGKHETAERDREIRSWLRQRGYDVIEITANELDDEGAMVAHFRKLAGYLRMDDEKKALRDDTLWHQAGLGSMAGGTIDPVIISSPVDDKKYATCLPVLDVRKLELDLDSFDRLLQETTEWCEWPSTLEISAGRFVASLVEGMDGLGSGPEPRFCLFEQTSGQVAVGQSVLLGYRTPEAGGRAKVGVRRFDGIRESGDTDVWRQKKAHFTSLGDSGASLAVDADQQDGYRVFGVLIRLLP